MGHPHHVAPASPPSVPTHVPARVRIAVPSVVLTVAMDYVPQHKSETVAVPAAVTSWSSVCCPAASSSLQVSRCPEASISLARWGNIPKCGSGCPAGRQCHRQLPKGRESLPHRVRRTGPGLNEPLLPRGRTMPGTGAWSGSQSPRLSVLLLGNTVPDSVHVESSGYMTRPSDQMIMVGQRDPYSMGSHRCCGPRCGLSGAPPRLRDDG